MSQAEKTDFLSLYNTQKLVNTAEGSKMQLPNRVAEIFFVTSSQSTKRPTISIH